MKHIQDIWTKIDYIFTKKQKRQLLGMIGILLGEAVLELTGVVSIYPFIAVMLSPQMIHTNPALTFFYQFLQIFCIPSHQTPCHL